MNKQHPKVFLGVDTNRPAPPILHTNTDTRKPITLDQLQYELLILAAQSALLHITELRDAWQRGSIHETDNLGGTRSNRNVEVQSLLQKALNNTHSRR